MAENLTLGNFWTDFQEIRPNKEDEPDELSKL